jgi:hypothetical protein
MIDYPKFTKMQNMFERQNHKRTNVPRERTKEEQKYYKLGGGEIKENNGRHHTTIIEGTYYK